MTDPLHGPGSLFDHVPDAGTPVSCPRVPGCRDHTPLRFTWPPAALADLGGSGPRLLVIAKNPSCPDDPDNQTLAPVMRVARELDAAALIVVNVLPVRRTEPREIVVADFDRGVLDANHAVVSKAVGWAEVVVAAWGRTDRLRAAPRRRLDSEISRVRGTLARHPQVVHMPHEKHPVAWTLNGLHTADLQPWHQDNTTAAHMPASVGLTQPHTDTGPTADPPLVRHLWGYRLTSGA